MLALWGPSPYHHPPALPAVVGLVALVFSATAIGLGAASVARGGARPLPALAGVALGLAAVGLVVLAIVTRAHNYPV